jgi:hypothetical protein
VISEERLKELKSVQEGADKRELGAGGELRGSLQGLCILDPAAGVWVGWVLARWSLWVKVRPIFGYEEYLKGLTILKDLQEEIARGQE